MKILCFIDSLGSGGAQRQMVELAKGFKQKGHDVSLLVYHDEPFFLSQIINKEIKYYLVQEDSYLKRILKIRKFIRGGDFDAVLSFLEAANFIATLSGFPYKKWKLVVGERSANPKILTSFKLRFYRWFHIFTDYVVANSNENINIIKKINPFVSANKYKVIYNIVDFEIWKPSNDYVPLKNGKLNLIVPASHQYIKNCEGLLNALSKLDDKELSKIQVQWFGDEKNDDSLKSSKNLVKQLGLSKNIDFYPAVPNLNEIMRFSDIVGLFSFHEGLPNVVCEAMSLGKVVIASDVSDIPNLLQNKNLIFNPHSTDDILNVLKRVINFTDNNIVVIGKTNNQRALKFFDKNQIIADYEKLLKE